MEKPDNRAVLLTGRSRLTVHNLQLQHSLSIAHVPAEANGTLKQMERNYILLALQEEGGSVERAARRLGIARSSLYNKLKRYRIVSPSGRKASQSQRVPLFETPETDIS